jgi:hypothetical protein
MNKTILSDKLMLNPNFIYILGLLWADGYITKVKNKYQISISLVDEDMKNLKHIFFEFANWKEYTYDLQKYGGGNNQAQTKFLICDKIFHTFLRENDYQIKSFVAPNKILSLIPSELHYHWFRGFVDGDGCFYFNQKYKTSRHSFSVSGPHKQDWKFLENFCESLEIKYNVSRFLSGKATGNGSTFIVRRTKDIIKLGNYLYKDSSFIRLERKYQKLINICNNYTPLTRTTKYQFVFPWKNGRAHYEFVNKTIRYYKSFDTEEEAYQGCIKARAELGLPYDSHMIKNSFYDRRKFSA